MAKSFGRQRALLLVVLVAVFGFYLTFIGRTLQYDEAYTLRHFAVSPGIALLSYTEPNNHMLHSLLVWISTTLAGTALIAVRFPALVMAILSLAMIYRVGGKLGGRRAGFAAAVFLSSNATFTDYAVNARGYTLSIFLTLVLIDLVFLSKPKPTRGYRYGLLLTCCGLILTLPTMAILIAAAVVWILWRSRRSSSALLPMLLGSVMGVIFYFPSTFYGSLSRSFGRFGYDDLRLLLSEWLNAVFGTPVIGAALLLCFGFGIAILLRRRDRRLLEMALSLVGFALFAALAQFALVGHVFYGRNYLYLLPLVCVIAAVGLTAVASRWSVSLALALLIAAALPLQTSLSQRTPVDDLLARFDTLLDTGDMILVSGFADEPIFYHLEARGQWDRLLLTPDKDRLIVITQPGDDAAALIATYQLESYIGACHVSEDQRWLPFTVYECAFAAG